MKQVLQVIIVVLQWVASYILMFIDRVLMSPWVYYDLPGMREIQDLDHEKDKVTKRLVFYLLIIIIIAAIYGLFHLNDAWIFIKSFF